MKKIIIVVLCFLILISGTILIYTLLNPKNKGIDEGVTTQNFGNEDYVLLNEYVNMKEYELKDLAYLNVYIESFNIIYKNNTLTINDKIIKNNVYLYKKIAFYSDAKLVLFVGYNNAGYGAYVIFNTLDDTYQIFEKAEKMNVIVNDNINFQNIGFSFNVSIVNQDKFIKDNKFICDFKDDRTVKKYVTLIYDSNSLKFDDFEVISSLNLTGYKLENGYC